MSNLDVSLDDLIQRNKSSSTRNPRSRTTGGSGSGSGSGAGPGPGPRRRFPNRAANRPAPYSSGPVQAPETTWDHDKFSDHAAASSYPPAARGMGVSGAIETGTKVFISNLDYGVSDEDIKELFAEAGDLKRCSIHYDKSGRSKGTAEVVFSRQRDAEAAIKRYNNIQLDGKPMKVEIARKNITTHAPPPTRNHAYGNHNPAPRSQQRGGGFRRPRGGGGSSRQERGKGRGRGENVSADDLDADLEKYHAEAMQTN